MTPKDLVQHFPIDVGNSVEASREISFALKEAEDDVSASDISEIEPCCIEKKSSGITLISGANQEADLFSESPRSVSSLLDPDGPLQRKPALEDDSVAYLVQLGGEPLQRKFIFSE